MKTLSTKLHRVYCPTTVFYRLIMGLVLYLTFQLSSALCQTRWEHHPDNPVLKLGASGSWDDYWIEPISVIRKDNMFHMWYFGANTAFKGGVGYASSADGVNWERHQDNPILTKGKSGAWNEAFIGGGAVLLKGDTFYLWFWGRNNDFSIWGIGLATSSDGITWTEYENNPVIIDAATGTWDDFLSMGYFNIIFDGERYMMWYDGGRDEFKQAGSGRYLMRIGCAASSDGIAWTPYENNPVLLEGEQSSDWDYWKVEMPTVIKNHTGYHIWFHGDNATSQIGYAHSEDGIHWTKCQDNPVLSPRKIGNWSQIGVMGPQVLYDETDRTYKMWYMGGPIVNGAQVSQIGYATSPEDTTASPVHSRPAGAMPDYFSLYQNYPNPFNPSTLIKYNLAKSSDVTLEVFSLTGQKLETLENMYKKAGAYQIKWQPEGLPSGIYFYRLQVGEQSETMKLILQK